MKAHDFGVDTPVLSLVHDTLEQLNHAFNHEFDLRALPDTGMYMSSARNSAISEPIIATKRWIDDRVLLNGYAEHVSLRTTAVA